MKYNGKVRVIAGWL